MSYAGIGDCISKPKISSWPPLNHYPVVSSLLNKTDCPQCGACVAACPKRAISFSKPDDCGDTHLEILPDACISCGLCEKVCPQMSCGSDVVLSTSREFYAGWSRSFRLRGSSGGVFGAMASYAIEHGWYVCGAAFDSDGVLKHRIISSISELPQLLGAKYVRSVAYLCFKDIRSLLRNGHKVLFCGTPCQVAGLRKFLTVEYEGLICVDLVCFGVPSQELYHAFTGKLGVCHTIKSFGFRMLTSNRPDLRYQDNEGWHQLRSSCFTYQEAFGMGLSHAKSCYHCKYKTMNRVGDITLGDYHSISRERPILRKCVSKGVSLIMVNTKDGGDFLHNITDLVLYPRTYEQARATNVSLCKCCEQPSMRDEFCRSVMSPMSLKQINTKFGFRGLRFAVFRLNPITVELLDLLKDIKHFLGR